MRSEGAELPDAYKKLLIVDDEPATLILLSQIFGRMGYSVSTAHDGFAALGVMRQRMPDILLSDLNMPGMSGFELLSVVRRRLPSMYVIATSGAYSGDKVPRGISADAFYEKATGFKLLLSLMETASQKRAPRILSPDACEPMWVPDGDGTQQANRVMIHCPECMRSFLHTCMDSRTQGDEFRQIGCLYCGTMIHYAIVQPLDPQTSQPYHPVLAATAASHARPEVLQRSEGDLARGISIVGKMRA
jgi:CheY-like chemotaxis protein